MLLPVEPPAVLSLDTCRHEIETLHEFFVDWYTGQTTGDTFDRVERALSSDFQMVTPDGIRREYADVVDGIDNQYAGREPGAFDIEIRNVETRYMGEDYALVRYEEWHETPNETTGRLSTVLFEENPRAPGEVVWLDLHETWLEGPRSDDE